MRKLNTKGETIVEVLIALLVIASVIGGAYAIVNRSNATIQSNKERYQAQLYANSQADALKVYAAQASQLVNLVENFVKTNKDFCIDSSGSPLAATDSGCKINDGGAEYRIIIKRSSDLSEFYTFVIRIEWDSLIDRDTDNLELIYGI